MHPTKELLVERNGLYCMLCGKELEYDKLNWHHIKPKAVSIENGEPIDNSYENGSLLCYPCHGFVHTYKYCEAEYHDLMCIIRSNKK